MFQDIDWCSYNYCTKTMAGNCLRSSIPVINRAASSRFIEFYDYKTEAIKKNPTVLFVPGFQSCGHGLKSQALIKHCQSKKLRYVCYDPEALGLWQYWLWSSQMGDTKYFCLRINIFKEN